MNASVIAASAMIAVISVPMIAAASPADVWKLRTEAGGALKVVSSARLFRQILVVCLLSLLIAGAASARSPIPAVNTEDGLAIKGYDPVSYFDSGEPTRGSAQFATTYKGVVYRFASAEHRGRFIAAPEKFVPQYGGYCAYAISLNWIADIDPDEWAIVNNKLYLNNGFFSQTLWSLDKSGNIAQGDRNWPLVPKLGNP
jgi:YHS domain-containing protein